MDAGRNLTRRHSFSTSKSLTTGLGGRGELTGGGEGGVEYSKSSSNIFKKFQRRRPAAASTVVVPGDPPFIEKTGFIAASSFTGSMVVGNHYHYDDNNRRNTDREKKGSGKSSWMRGIKLKKKKKAKMMVTSSARTRYEEMEKHKNDPDMLSTIDGESVRVVVTELCPQAYYKVLPITCYTTAFEVIVKLIQKYGEDEDPNSFYLTEVKESDLGSYSRVLENSDQLHEVQSRWDVETECCFALCRSHMTVSNSVLSIEDDKEATPQVEDKKTLLRAMIISPSQDSFYGYDYPGISELEEGDVLPSPPNTSHPPPSPKSSQSSTNSFQDISSRLQSSKLILNPSEPTSLPPRPSLSPSEDTSYLPRSSSTSTAASERLMQAKSNIKSGKLGLKFISFSDSSIETITEQNEPVAASHDLSSGMENQTGTGMRTENESEKDKLTRRQIMQRSIRYGMQDIMAKVVSETKQNSPNHRRLPHYRSSTAPPSLLSEDFSPQRDVPVRPLLFSPYARAPAVIKRHTKLPNFEFSPFSHAANGYSSSSEETDGSTVGSLVTPGKKSEEEREEEREEKGEREKCLPDQLGANNLAASSCTRMNTKEERNLIIIREVNPFKSSELRAESPKRIETNLILLSRHRYTTSARFMSVIKDRPHYQSDMDLLQPLSNILDTKLNYSHGNIHRASSSTTSINSEASQSAKSSPSFRSTMTDYSSPKKTSVTKLKRPHSFHVSKFVKSSYNCTDFTKDEIIRKAALEGRPRKLNPKGQKVNGTATPVTPSRKVLLPPSQEAVTDLDVLLQERQRHKMVFTVMLVVVQKRHQKLG